jgi:hypothetical protein
MTAPIQIAPISPAIFTLNSSSLTAAMITWAHPDGTQSFDTVYRTVDSNAMGLFLRSRSILTRLAIRFIYRCTEPAFAMRAQPAYLRQSQMPASSITGRISANGQPSNRVSLVFQ